ncbi:MAG TPA: hypothetical protein VFM93_03455 [Candidatus Limnocylindria bacterium]|nr:hypothetical protein [Candidatus Limnocylindria bacterium]
MWRALRVAAALAVAVAAQLPLTEPADAHERRSIGPYQVIVGFLVEPAFAGESNGASIQITDTRTNTPVEGVERTLTVDITAGGRSQALSLPLTTRFGQPGSYVAHFVPTREGGYSFVFKGRIGEQTVNERFESGPGRFNDVQSLAAVQYPDRVPAGADLGARLDAIAATAERTQWIALAAAGLGALALALALLRRRA